MIEICYAKHGYPLGHPRYLGHPRFHDCSSSGASANSTVADLGQQAEEGALKDASQ